MLPYRPILLPLARSGGQGGGRLAARPGAFRDTFPRRAAPPTDATPRAFAVLSQAVRGLNRG